MSTFRMGISNFTTKLLTILCPLVSHSPDAADSSSFDVQLGDIILTATDGLFDNMPDYMILHELKKLKVPETSTYNTSLCPFFCLPMTLIRIVCSAFRIPTMKASSKQPKVLLNRPMF